MITDKLRKKLLSRGGKSIDEEITGWPEYLDRLTLKSRWASRWFDPAKLGVIEFSLSSQRCHDNLTLLAEDVKYLQVYTGFALSMAGIWRNHTWGVYAKHHIVETTAPFSMYLGTEIPLAVLKTETQGLASQCCETLGLPTNLSELFQKAVAKTQCCCPKCKELKSLSEFTVKTSGHLWKCRACNAKEVRERRLRNPEQKIREAAAMRKYRAANPEKCRAIGRAWAKNNPEKLAMMGRRKNYGMEPAEYDMLLKSQNNSCAICGLEFLNTRKGDTPFVDHCHKTGKVRALLCLKCNHGLGAFQDSPRLCFLAASYLQKYS